MSTLCLAPLLVSLGLAGEFRQLHADHAEASSFLKSNWNKYEENYHPSYVLDDDPKTAWVEGVEGDGVGESVTVPLSTLSRARAVKVQVRNGYQKSAGLLTANGAPRTLTVIVLDGNGKETARTSATLQRVLGFQDIVIATHGGGVGAVRLVIDEVEPGKVYRDTCISDVRVFVDSDVPYNAKAESAKKAALLSWRKERVETARFFARLPAAWPWVASTFRTEEDPVVYASTQDTPAPVSAHDYRTLRDANHPALKAFGDVVLADLDKLVQLRDGPAPPEAKLRRVEPAGRRVTLPDGVELPRWLQPFLQKEGLVFVESAAQAKPRTEGLGLPPYFSTSGGVTLSDVLVDGPDLFLTVTTTIRERTETTETQQWLLRYDDAGRLLRAAFVGHGSETHGLMLENPKPEDIYTTTMGETSGAWAFVWEQKIKAVERVEGFKRCADDDTDTPQPCRFGVQKTRFVP